MPVRLPLLLPSNTCRYSNLLVSLLRPFHTTSIWESESVDHYAALGLEPYASQATIKKQFYTLSKTHHPDHNPKDPTASERFVKISEAYAVLGKPEKRSKYDRETGNVASGAQPSSRRGSHPSSAFGSRPASGLSKRRTQFRGPPPSFYKSGGWGTQGAKRQSQAEGPTSAAGGGTSTPESEVRGGFGPGQGQAGWDYDVPHFDQHGHRRTQEQQERRWMLRRKAGEEDERYGGASMLIQFILVGGIVVAALALPTLFEPRSRPRRKSES